MKKAKINKVEMARRMNTSRATLDRLEPNNTSVTLQTPAEPRERLDATCGLSWCETESYDIRDPSL